MTDVSNAAVIITCFELGRTLGEAVESVQGQTRVPAEMIVVDDGSRDSETVHALQRLERSGIPVHRLDHGGVARARNAGVQLTRAPFVLFLDADDRLAPTCLEKMSARLAATPELAFVSCAVQAFEGATYRWRPPAVDFIGTLTRGSVHISSLFRRELWERIGGFDPTLPAYEDLDFWLRAIDHGFRGDVLDDPLLHYRVRPESRYRRGLEPGPYQDAMQRIVRKHPERIREHGLDLLASKEAFIVQLQAHQEALRSQQELVRWELASVQVEVSARQRAARKLTAGAAVILAYHRIGSVEWDPHGLCTSPAQLEAHLRHLKEHCTPIGLGALQHGLECGELPERAVAVTFDDGYLDALTTAAPMLVAHGIPATFFVNTARMGEQHECWQDELEHILSGPRLAPRFVLVDEDEPVVLDLSAPEARRTTLLELQRRLVPLSASRREAILGQLRREAARRGLDLYPRPDRRLLTSEEIKVLAGLPGCSIGSHSENHLFLPSQAPEVQRHEIRAAKAQLEQLLDQPVRFFCYPFGATSPDLALRARCEGHQLGFTTEAGAVTPRSDSFLLPRLEVAAFSAAGLSERLEELFSEERQQRFAQNEVRLRESIARRETTLESRPQFLIVDPTSRCNARCVTCPVSFRPPGETGTDLPPSIFEKVAPLLPFAAHINLFASGEPTLNRELTHMVDRCRRDRASRTPVWVSTNGKRLSAALIDQLAEAGMGLQFSVDGGTREIFESIRQGIRFNQLLASLELARSRKRSGKGLALSFSTTVSKQNVHDLANVFALAQRYEVDQVIFYNEDPESPERARQTLDDSDRAVFEAQLPFIQSTGVRALNGLVFGKAREQPEHIHCVAPWKVFFVKAEGTVHTCCTLRQSMGNLNHQTIEEIWNGEAYVGLRRAFVEQRGLPEACHTCTDPLRNFRS